MDENDELRREIQQIKSGNKNTPFKDEEEFSAGSKYMNENNTKSSPDKSLSLRGTKNLVEEFPSTEQKENKIKSSIDEEKLQENVIVSKEELGNNEVSESIPKESNITESQLKEEYKSIEPDFTSYLKFTVSPGIGNLRLYFLYLYRLLNRVSRTNVFVLLTGFDYPSV